MLGENPWGSILLRLHRALPPPLGAGAGAAGHGAHAPPAPPHTVCGGRAEKSEVENHYTTGIDGRPSASSKGEPASSSAPSGELSSSALSE